MWPLGHICSSVGGVAVIMLKTEAGPWGGGRSPSRITDWTPFLATASQEPVILDEETSQGSGPELQVTSHFI